MHTSRARLTFLLPLLIIFTTLAQCSSPKHQILRQPFISTRLILHSTNNFTTVMSTLYAEIGTVPQFPVIVRNGTSYNETSKQTFIEAIKRAVGPRGFMIFQEFNHGFWIPLFSFSANLGLKRIILGNPLVAVTMLEHSLTAALAVPVEVLVWVLSREEGGGTDLVWNLPSQIVVGGSRDWELR